VKEGTVRPAGGREPSRRVSDFEPVESTSTSSKARPFAGPRWTEVLGRPSQSWVSPVPRKRAVGDTGAREKRRGGELTARRALLLGSLGPRVVSPSQDGLRRWSRGDAKDVSTRSHAAGRRRFGQPHSTTTRKQKNEGVKSLGEPGRNVRRVCPCVVSVLQKSMSGVWLREAR